MQIIKFPLPFSRTPTVKFTAVAKEYEVGGRQRRISTPTVQFRALDREYKVGGRQRRRRTPTVKFRASPGELQVGRHKKTVVHFHDPPFLVIIALENVFMSFGR